MNDTTRPRYPLYIVSKGRWDTRITHRSLSAMGVHHFMVVEEQERERYAAAVSPRATLLTLDPKYQHEYDTCDDLGSTKSKGPGAARNFAWEHSISNGHAAHWVMDDNIQCFFRLNRNRKIRFGDGTPFCIMEDFFDRYSNLAMEGPNYYMFAPRKVKVSPYVMNTRIYSCNLIRNDVPYRWRGRYNEDTDLSLRMLKDGWCTIQFYAFLQQKLVTQLTKGGNTAEFYAREGTKPKSEMLVKLHPDVAEVVWKFQRWHHHVDYSRFEKNELMLRPGVVIPDGVNEYGLELKTIQPGASYDDEPIFQEEDDDDALLPGPPEETSAKSSEDFLFDDLLRTAPDAIKDLFDELS